MTIDEFKDRLDSINNGKTYGMCPQPIRSQEALDILIEHFLGTDWYVWLSVSQEQVNAEAVFAILKQSQPRGIGKMLSKLKECI